MKFTRSHEVNLIPGDADEYEHEPYLDQGEVSFLSFDWIHNSAPERAKLMYEFGHDNRDEIQLLSHRILLTRVVSDLINCDHAPCKNRHLCSVVLDKK